MKSAKVPDGTTTRDIDMYVRSWRDLARPIEIITGWKCYGFNPGLLMSRPKGPSVNIDTDLALAVGKLYNRVSQKGLTGTANGDRLDSSKQATQQVKKKSGRRARVA